MRISFLWQLTSSSLYEKLHEFFILPSVRRLQSLSSSAAISSGQIDVEYLSQKTRNLPPHEKIVTLVMDEVYVAQRIEYTDGAFVGLAADGSSAKTVLSFMVQSVCSNYKDMICLIPVSKLDTSILHTWLHKVLVALHNLKFLLSLLTTISVTGKPFSCFLFACD